MGLKKKKRLFMNKRAQITAFMIIGIIILVISSILLSLRGKVTDEKLRFNLKPTVESVPQAGKPLQSFVLGCVRSTLKDGVKKLGRQAGYIYVDDLGLRMGYSPIDSQALMMNPEILPYWYFFSPEVNTFASLMPPLNKADNYDISVEGQLDTYVKRNLPRCINDFRDFRKIFEIEAGEINVDTRVTREGVITKVVYPLEVRDRSTGSKISMEEFYGELDVKIERMFRLARKIIAEEARTAFLEKKIMNFISIYSGKDEELPPLSEMTLMEPHYNIWVKSEVKQVMKSKILPLVSMIQIPKTLSFNTKYYAEGEDKVFKTSFYNNMILGFLDEFFPDVAVSFSFPAGSEIYLNVGEGGEIIKARELSKPDGGNILSSMLGAFIKDYRFRYDLTTPIMINMNNPDAFDGEGYSFRVPLQVNIRGNYPLLAGENFVYEPREEEITGEIDMFENRMLWPDKRHTFYVKDALTGETIENARIFYDCGQEVFIGATDYDEETGRNQVKSKLPYCVNGNLFARKEGYLEDIARFSNEEDGENPLFYELSMYPAVDKKILIRRREPEQMNLLKLRVEKGEDVPKWNSGLSSERWDEQDNVILTIKRKPENDVESNFPMVGFWLKSGPIEYDIGDTVKEIEEKSGDFEFSELSDIEELQGWDGNISTLDETGFGKNISDIYDAESEKVLVEGEAQGFKEMEFVPGEYEVSITALRVGTDEDPAVHIPKEKREYCDSWDGCTFKDKKEITLPEQKLNTWPVGMAKFSVNLTEEDLYNDKDVMILFYPQSKIPENYDDLEKVSKQFDYPETILSKILAPEFERLSSIPEFVIR